ncbi:MAG: S8 family serine peptidase, partial [Candidatus Krumholzibacteria bacterium]|nr:S8 family serine peptidase [Candidatus Krumholzibacteria bacterium]
ILEPLRQRDAASIDGSRIVGLGARVDAVSGSYMRVLVPLRLLKNLSELPDVKRIRAPTPAIPVDAGFGPIVSESVALTGADAVQLAGFDGAGVKVAVVDLGFIGLSDAITAGELPAGVVRVKGNQEGVNIELGNQHGVGVAEHVMDMAPGAELYCIYIEDEVDLENAADYLSANGIRIANHSVAWVNASYYDDTGPIASIINESSDLDGVFWAVASGNFARRHWRGNWFDPEGNDTLNFAGDVERMDLSGTSETAFVFLNWDQYGNSLTDLDLYIKDKNGIIIAESTDPQNGSQEPSEGVTFPYLSSEIPYTVEVVRYSGPTEGLDVTVFSFRHDFLYNVESYSLMEPADAHGAFTAGAIDYGDWGLPDPPPEYFSSQGPTTDGRLKPDIMAPDGTTSWTYGASYGTSFASPTTAGAAALMLQIDP